MENSIFFQILTLIICFGLGGGMIVSSILNWKYWHKALAVASIIIGVGLLYYGIIIITMIL